MRIVLNIEEEDIERIARSLDNQYAYTLARNLEDSTTRGNVPGPLEAWAGTRYVAV